MLGIDDLKYNADGLIPAIVQDYQTKQVLMMAYMSRESLEATLKEGRTCFYSRSRQALWRKGETSGNTQQVVAVTADCDADTLVVQVLPAGPACHTGSVSCFFNGVYQDEEEAQFDLQALYGLIEDRRLWPQQGSYTTYLFEKGREKILKKVGEECTEVVIAAMKRDNEETVFEIADLCYHLMVLMAECGITTGQVLEELGKRHVVDKKVKQETMA